MRPNGEGTTFSIAKHGIPPHDNPQHTDNVYFIGKYPFLCCVHSTHRRQ